MPIGEYVIPKDFDVLVAATQEHLAGVRGWVEYDKPDLMPGLARWHLRQWQLGDLGDVSVRKMGNNLSLFDAGDVPHPDDEEALTYLLTYYRKEFTDEQIQMIEKLSACRRESRLENGNGVPEIKTNTIPCMKQLGAEKQREWVLWFLDIEREAVKRLAKQREKHKQQVIIAYFNKLEHDEILNDDKLTMQGKDARQASAGTNAQEKLSGAASEQQGKRKRSKWDDTDRKIQSLKEYRSNWMQEHKGEIPKWTHACQAIGIDPKTARIHAAELRKRWEDKEY